MTTQNHNCSVTLSAWFKIHDTLHEDLTVLTENEDTEELLKSKWQTHKVFPMGSPNSPCTWLQRMTVNIKQQQLDKNVFLDHAKSSFQTWEKTASMLSVEFHNPLISSAHSHPSNTLHCIPWHSQSCHSKSPGAEGGWGAPASQGCDTGLGSADVWPHHMNHDCLTSSTRPGSSLSAESVIQDLQRKHFFFFFYSWSVLLPAKQILKGEQCQTPMRKSVHVL